VVAKDINYRVIERRLLPGEQVASGRGLEP